MTSEERKLAEELLDVILTKVGLIYLDGEKRARIYEYVSNELGNIAYELRDGGGDLVMGRGCVG